MRGDQTSLAAVAVNQKPWPRRYRFADLYLHFLRFPPFHTFCVLTHFEQPNTLTKTLMMNRTMKHQKLGEQADSVKNILFPFIH